PEPVFHHGSGMVVRNVDADPALELIITEGRNVFAYDGSTQLLDWSISGSTDGNKLVVFDRDAACRLALYGDRGYREYPCGAGAAGTMVTPSTLLTRVLPATLGGNTLLAISREHLVVLDTASGMTT